MKQHPYTTLWLLLAVGLLPLLAALLMYFGGFGVPEGRVNHGRLVLDQPPLPSWQLRGDDGQLWDGRGKWQLLQVDLACDPQCQRWRRSLKQLHRALGRERNRVQPHWVVGAQSTASGVLRLGLEHPLDSLAEGIWLADPRGNLVLYYGYDQSPRDLLDDLKRLLKLSKVG